jgi:hypothetical protein
MSMRLRLTMHLPREGAEPQPEQRATPGAQVPAKEPI